MRRRLPGLALAAALLAGCGGPRSGHAIGAMPGPVQQVLDTRTLAGPTIAAGILTLTGHKADLASDTLPGYYSYGPARGGPDGSYYVDVEVPVNLGAVSRRLGYPARPVRSTAYRGLDWIPVVPLRGMAGDRLYFNPRTGYASFLFRLEPDGAVLDESWDAVAVNS
ncbi:MAG: hypothetical protein OWV35_07305 [Firmicutes bacterium]|nr:hypothetical protein [Bacillota bacterium]